MAKKQVSIYIDDETMEKTLGKEASDEMKESINQYYDAQEKIVDEKTKKIKDILDIDGEIYEGLPIKRNSET